MRHGRAKAARRTLQFFQRTQGINPPYHILLDGNFIVAVIRFKIPLLERLATLLQRAKFHLYVTRSTLQELERLIAQVAASSSSSSSKKRQQQPQQQEQQSGEDTILQEETSKAVLLNNAHKWAMDNANVIDVAAEQEVAPPTQSQLENLQSKESLVSSVAGKDLLRLVMASSSSGTPQESDSKQHTRHEPQQKYMLASQDEELLDVVRHLGSVPVIRLANGTVLLLEQPSKSANQHAIQSERHKWTSSVMTEKERDLVKLFNEEEKQQKRQNTTSTAAPTDRNPYNNQRRKPKAKGPNPLSCRKKKKDGNETTSERPTKRRRQKK
jgi:U3 small nucleolar RNA-associated protein 23